MALKSLVPDAMKAWARSRRSSIAVPGKTSAIPIEVFDEASYLAANPDVAEAVARGVCTSGRAHYEAFGQREGRPLRTNHEQVDFSAAKARKLERIAPLLKNELPHLRNQLFYDFLTDDLRMAFAIPDDGPVSSNDYDADGLELFRRHASGLVLDVGAGRRSVYYENVVNFEIAPYSSTDVRGVAETLPFVDDAFDAVISIAVLEHVRDPFRAASEIVRVLKPGGELICCVPFLQPLHGYPHHYYNMTHQGLRNLFDKSLIVDRITVPASTLPIWSLTWILKSWSDGLTGEAREEFLAMRVSELVDQPTSYLGRPWITGLSTEKNLELASANVLFAHKPVRPRLG